MARQSWTPILPPGHLPRLAAGEETEDESRPLTPPDHLAGGSLLAGADVVLQIPDLERLFLGLVFDQVADRDDPDDPFLVDNG